MPHSPHMSYMGRVSHSSVAHRSGGVLTARTPRASSPGEVNERYRQHPATGSFAVQTEGEITRWDTFAAHRSTSLRHTGRRSLRCARRSGTTRKGSRNEVVAPPRRRPRAVAMRHRRWHEGHVGQVRHDKRGASSPHRQEAPPGHRRARADPTDARHAPRSPHAPSSCSADHLRRDFHEGTRGPEPSSCVPQGGRP